MWVKDFCVINITLSFFTIDVFKVLRYINFMVLLKSFHQFKIMGHASLEFIVKSVCLHLSAKANCYCLLAFLFSFSSRCFASWKFLVIFLRWLLSKALKAWFLVSIKSISVYLAPENQFGLFLIFALAVSIAFFTIWALRLPSSSDGVRWTADPNESFSIFFNIFLEIW